MLFTSAFSQNNSADTAITPIKDIPVLDTTLNYDELFQDFDAFMDSILSPHSYLLASLSMSKGYYNFERKNSYLIETSKKLTYSPTLGFYHKGGLGITGTGYIVDDGVNLNFYQGAITPSYDYLNNKSLATGISYTKFFTKDSLPFYTTPLQNELYEVEFMNVVVDKANDCHELWVGKPDGFYATGGIDTRLAVTQERVHLYQYRRKNKRFFYYGDPSS